MTLSRVYSVRRELRLAFVKRSYRLSSRLSYIAGGQESISCTASSTSMLVCYGLPWLLCATKLSTEVGGTR
jgi:hypothetical protein